MGFYPRGNPLTEPAAFTARDGVLWLVYVEGLPPPPARLFQRTALPVRRLRFDAETESRASVDLPVGAPFLSEARLQECLDHAEAIPFAPVGNHRPFRRHRIVELAARVHSHMQAVADDWATWWREGAPARQAFLERCQELVASAVQELRMMLAKMVQSTRRRSR